MAWNGPSLPAPRSPSAGRSSESLGFRRWSLGGGPWCPRWDHRAWKALRQRRVARHGRLVARVRAQTGTAPVRALSAAWACPCTRCARGSCARAGRNRGAGHLGWKISRSDVALFITATKLPAEPWESLLWTASGMLFKEVYDIRPEGVPQARQRCGNAKQLRNVIQHRLKDGFFSLLGRLLSLFAD